MDKGSHIVYPVQVTCQYSLLKPLPATIRNKALLVLLKEHWFRKNFKWSFFKYCWLFFKLCSHLCLILNCSDKKVLNFFSCTMINCDFIMNKKE